MRLFIDALWSPAWKGLTSRFSFVMSNSEVVTFPIGILGQVWCLIVSILIFALFLTLKGNSCLSIICLRYKENAVLVQKLYIDTAKNW